MDKEQLINELQDALNGMDIPQMRKRDIGWLNRNISINNSNHPNFLKATWLIKQIMKEEKNGK